jgi:hypothetical protein
MNREHALGINRKQTGTQHREIAKSGQCPGMEDLKKQNKFVPVLN